MELDARGTPDRDRPAETATDGRCGGVVSTGIGRRGQEERGGADDTGTIHEFYRA
jgi:hypothetical protein